MPYLSFRQRPKRTDVAMTKTERRALALLLLTRSVYNFETTCGKIGVGAYEIRTRSMRL